MSKQLQQMKRRCRALVQHMDRETMLRMGDLKFRRSWLREHFAGWSQGLETHLQVQVATQLRRRGR